MKRLLQFLFVVLVMCVFSMPVFAEPKGSQQKTDDLQQDVSNSGGDEMMVHLEPKQYPAVTSDMLTPTLEYEGQVIKVQGLLNELSPAVAILAQMSGDTFMKGNDKTLYRLTDVVKNVMANFLIIAENYKPLDDPLVLELKKRLAKVSAYQFGPDRLDVFDISVVANEGKGWVDITIRYEDAKDDAGNAIRVPVKQKVRYAVTPGLSATKQNEREVIIVDRLPDGEYKVATGIFYAGENTVTMYWDPRTYTRVDWLLDYHNACADQKAWLSCNKSKCVKYSLNATVTN